MKKNPKDKANTDNKKEPKDRLPICWYILLIIIGGIGLALFFWNPKIPQEFHNLSRRVRPDAWMRLIGIYLISMVITHSVVSFFNIKLKKLLELKESNDKIPNLWSPAIVGLLENIIYPTVIVIQKVDFIGIWLAVKVAGQWVRWGYQNSSSRSETKDENWIKRADEGRRRFNKFLVGNALQIIASFLTYGALKIWTLK